MHRVFSLVKRVLDGTYQGSAQPEHLQAYLDEFVFRFNCRGSHKRGLLFFRLLEAAIAGSPVPCKDLAVVHSQPMIVPNPPSAPRLLPRTLAGDPIERPWRASTWLLEAAAAGTARMNVMMAEAVTLAKIAGAAEVDQAP